VGGFGRAAVGDHEYTRASALAEVTFALPARTALSLETEGGTSWGSPSVQRLWFVGGPLSLRGHAPLAMGGDTFWRGRSELVRAFSFGGLALFCDVAWAGARGAADLDDALASAGLGLALLDDILRVDGAWGLEAPHRFRLDVYLDQIL
jgi:hypothetical protein